MHVYYPLFYNPDPMPRAIHALELIFNFSQVRERFAGLIARWVGLQEPYQSVMGLFLAATDQHPAPLNVGSAYPLEPAGIRSANAGA
jgi:hypothetical protein